MNPLTPNLESQPSTQPRKVVAGGSLVKDQFGKALTEGVIKSG